MTTTTRTPVRPKLRRIPLASVWPPGRVRGLCYATMSENQWDSFLAAAYSVGFVLVELDDAERPVAAYQRPEPETN